MGILVGNYLFEPFWFSSALCAMLQNHTLLSGADYCTMHSFAI